LSAEDLMLLFGLSWFDEKHIGEGLDALNFHENNEFLSQ
jgi:hypothetical protein